MPYSGRTVYRVGDRRRWGVDDYLADALGAERTGRLIAAFEFHPELSHIESCRQLVLHERILDDTAGVIVRDVFIERHPYALDEAAFGLDPRKVGIYRSAAVDD